MTMTTASITPKMNLSELLGSATQLDMANDRLIHEICVDSREIGPNSLFIAVPGISSDGRKFIRQAIDAGASAIFFEQGDFIAEPHSSVIQVGMRGLRRKLSIIADRFYGCPSSKIHVIGITGTNGKSTVASLTAQALEKIERKCAIIGTLGSGFPDQLTLTSLTTPDPVSLQRELASALNRGAGYACLEVSSHALDQARTSGVRFSTVVFTNLSQDHLDYHRSEEHYRASKAKLFTESAAKRAVINIDDDFGIELINKSNAESLVTYGKNKRADVQLSNCTVYPHGLELEMVVKSQKIRVNSRLLGRFNSLNLVATAATLHAIGVDASLIEQALSEVEPVTGRLELVSNSSLLPAVYVDYAHTPDGLARVLKSLREVTRGQIWCVFGCGGNRDVAKRPMMGEIAERHSDNVILTDDNPRAENPAQIVGDIKSGMKNNPFVEHNRRQAIYFAISQAQAEDAVLIAGKGHEKKQIYADRSVAFNDREIADEMLRSLR